MPKYLKVLALLLLVTALITPAAFAQGGRISGKVVDQQGGILPGATMQLVNTDSGLAVSVVTNAAGVYNFPSVDSDNYRLKVSLSGFADWVREPIVVATRQGLIIDVSMAVAGVAETGRPLIAFSQNDLNGNGRRGDPAGNSGLDYTEVPNGEFAGRGNCSGSATTTVDIRVVKFIRFGGAKELQLMAESCNITNCVNRGRNFERTFESASFGEWDQSGLETNQLQMQLGVRFNF